MKMKPKHGMSRCSFRALVFITVQLLVVQSGKAQPALAADVRTAFIDIAETPRTVHIKNKGIKIPSGGHLQGIQRLSDSLLIITASSGSYAYYLTAELNRNGSEGQIKSVQKITDSPFRHAGGCQIYDHKMVVGVEDNKAKNKSDIIMISFNGKRQETARRVIAHRQGLVKRSTAGAVGFTKTISGQYLVVVGDWDSKYFDVYLSKPGNDALFDSIATFHTPEIERGPSYQAINLITDTTGKIYLLGFSKYGMHNRADLWQLDLGKDEVHLIYSAVSNFGCRGGAGFRYGSGIDVINKHQFIIYSCSRGIRPFITVNIFDKRRSGYVFSKPKTEK